jgi:Tfp pilus assembly protein PilF
MTNKQNSIPRKEAQCVFDLYSKGETQQAIIQIKALNEKYPNQPLLFNLIGACYKKLDQLEGAIKMFGVAISLNPDYSEAHFNLGVTFQDLNQKKSAKESYLRAIEINPNYAEAHNNLGNVLRDLGELKASIESFEWAIAYKYDYAEAHNNLGNTLSDFGQTDSAIDSFKKAISLNPNYARAVFNLALVYRDIGNQKACQEMIEKTIRLKPHWSYAHLELSRVKKYQKNDSYINEIHSYLDNPKLSTKDRINFNLILAKVYEDIDNHEKLFKFLNEANKLRKKEANYSFEIDQKLFTRIKRTFKHLPKALESKTIKSATIRPIFIVGMPRSGTSLVHQIVSSHPLVHGAGELTKLYKFSTPFLSESKDDKNNCLSESALKSIRYGYLDSLLDLNVSEKIIIDKMPLNFRFIGFIMTAFPDAKIIHMNRDPMATCWSIYKYYFPGNHYSNNQEDTANYYSLYLDLMKFWSKLFPNKIYDLSYENLTTNQEVETKKLLDYCDLDWNESCLNYFDNKTSVKTTSSIQVKQKMYQGSSEVWKKYENFLHPMLKVLNKYE